MITASDLTAAGKLRDIADAFERGDYGFDLAGEYDMANPCNRIVFDCLRDFVVQGLHEAADRLVAEQ